MTSLLVISPAASPKHGERMCQTARRVGIEPLLYGFDSHHTHGKDYQGTDIVKILAASSAEFVMCVDAPDVCFLAGEQELLDRLSEFEHPFVVSAEQDGVSGMPLTSQELLRQCESAGGYHAQLNIGCWIGRREYVLHCFNEAERLYGRLAENPSYSYDNHFQHLTLMKAWGGREPETVAIEVRALAGLGGPEFHLDTHCRIFQSMNKAATMLERGKRVRNRVTDTLPCVLHYNGDPTREAFNAMADMLLRADT